MTRQGWRWSVWCWWCAGAVAATAAEGVTFQLNPPAGQSVPVRSVASITVLGDASKAPPRYVEQSETLGTVLISGSGDKRWLTHRITKSTLTVNGQPRADKIAAALAGQSVGYAFDAQGKLTAIRGLEGLSIQLKQSLGPGAPGREQLAPYYQRSWDLGFGRFWSRLAGRTVEPGVTWKDEGAISLQHMGLPALPVTGTWTFLGMETPSGGRARVQFAYTAEPVPLGAAEAAFRQWLIPRVPALTNQTWAAVQAEERCELLTDPATLLAGELTCRTSLRVEGVTPSPITLQIDSTWTTWVGP